MVEFAQKWLIFECYCGRRSWLLGSSGSGKRNRRPGRKCEWTSGEKPGRIHLSKKKKKETITRTNPPCCRSCTNQKSVLQSTYENWKKVVPIYSFNNISKSIILSCQFNPNWSDQRLSFSKAVLKKRKWSTWSRSFWFCSIRPCVSSFLLFWFLKSNRLLSE